eukprot:5188884-Pyramimonas_sp.AAC.1
MPVEYGGRPNGDSFWNICQHHMMWLHIVRREPLAGAQRGTTYCEEVSRESSNAEKSGLDVEPTETGFCFGFGGPSSFTR